MDILIDDIGGLLEVLVLYEKAGRHEVELHFLDAALDRQLATLEAAVHESLQSGPIDSLHDKFVRL